MEKQMRTELSDANWIATYDIDGSENWRPEWDGGIDL